MHTNCNFGALFCAGKANTTTSTAQKYRTELLFASAQFCWYDNSADWNNNGNCIIRHAVGNCYVFSAQPPCHPPPPPPLSLSLSISLSKGLFIECSICLPYATVDHSFSRYVSLNKFSATFRSITKLMMTTDQDGLKWYTNTILGNSWNVLSCADHPTIWLLVILDNFLPTNAWRHISRYILCAFPLTNCTRVHHYYYTRRSLVGTRVYENVCTNHDLTFNWHESYPHRSSLLRKMHFPLSAKSMEEQYKMNVMSR